MNRRQESIARRLVIKISLVLIVVLAALLYLGSTIPPQLEEQEGVDEEDSKGVIEEVVEEIVSDVDEEAEEIMYGISSDYILSKKDCKCYSVDEEVPEGRLDCRGIFGLVGCSDAGVEIKGYMIDKEGNIKEEYLNDLGLA